MENLQGFIAAKAGTRPGKVSVKISNTTKLITFSSAFIQTYFRDNKPVFLKQFYSKNENKIAVEFMLKDDNSGEVLKLSYTRSSLPSAACSTTPILNYFYLKIDDISGTYKEDAINKHSKNVLVLDISKREVHKQL